MSPIKNRNLGHFTPGVDSPGWLMWEMTLLWKRKLDQKLEKYDLTNYQVMILRALLQVTQNGDVVNQAELADYLRTNVMMTSNVLRTLEKKNLVSRQPHPSDTRAKVIVLTEQGIEMAEKGLQEIITLNQEIFGKSEQISSQLVQNLKQLLDLNIEN